MKCEHCGNNLSLEDKVCPYCGRENKLAAKHNQDMDKYEEDYASVKKEVLSNSRRFNGFTARLTIAAILIALLASVLVAYGHKYDIRSAREERQILAHYNEHKATIDGLIRSRDHLGLYQYCRVNKLSYLREFDEYYAAYTASERYADICDQIFYLNEESPYYFKPEESFEEIASASQKINEMRKPQHEYENEKYYSNQEVVAYINDLADHSDLIIRGYFGMDEEEMEAFKSMSKARKQLKLEEGWNNEE